MSIGDLYDANNVVVGQAAVFFAPRNTVLPAFTSWNQADPFDPAYLLTYTIPSGGTATSFTITVTNSLGQATTTSLTVAGLTAAAIAAALTALPNVGAGGATVTGASAPWSIVLHSTAEGSTLSVTPTGGTLSITNPVWVPCGATDQGWTFGANKSTQAINIEEQSTPVATTITNQAVSIAGALSEDITRTLNLALNATSVATAPAVGTVPGYDTISLTDTVLNYAVTMVTTNAEGFGRIIYAPAWTQLSNVSTAFRRAVGNRDYAIQFDTVCQTNQIKIYNFTLTK